MAVPMELAGSGKVKGIIGGSEIITHPRAGQGVVDDDGERRPVGPRMLGSTL